MSAFISLTLVVVLVLHTILYDIRLNMSILPSIYTYHSYTLIICTLHRTIHYYCHSYYIIKYYSVVWVCSEGVCAVFSMWCILWVVCWAVVVSSNLGAPLYIIFNIFFNFFCTIYCLCPFGKA